MADLKSQKGISEKDRKLLEEAESLLGPEPESMGFVKNLFWGRVREELLFPYPDWTKQTPEETAECDRLLAELETYLKNEHPSIRRRRSRTGCFASCSTWGCSGSRSPGSTVVWGWGSRATTACWR